MMIPMPMPASQSHYASQPQAFPSEISMRSADGRWVLLNVDGMEQRERFLKEGHALFLLDLKTGQSTKLLAYNRHADACFSPDGKHLLITDWNGSDSAEVRLFTLTDTARRVSLDRWLNPMRKRHPERRDTLPRSLQALGWEDARVFRLLWWGYGEGEEKHFRTGLEINLDGGAEEVYPPEEIRRSAK
jgi:hypothetical protein